MAIDEGIDQPALAFLEVAKRPFKALPPGEGVLLATSPDIEDDNPEQAKNFVGRSHAAKKVEEAGLQFVSGDAGLPTSRSTRAVVVGVADLLTFAPGASQRLAAVAATDKPSEGKIGVVALPLSHTQPLFVEEALDPPPDLGLDQRGEGRRHVNSPLGNDDAACVERTAEQAPEGLRRQLLIPSSAKAHLSDLGEHLILMVKARRKELEGLADERSPFRIQRERALAQRTDAEVAQGWLPDPAATLRCLLHSTLDLLALHAIVELTQEPKDPLDDLTKGVGAVNREAGEPEHDRHASQLTLQDQEVEHVPGEAHRVGNYEEVEVAVVLPAVGEQFLQAGAIGGLGGLSLLRPNRVDLNPFGFAIAPAEALLVLEGVVSNLFFGADACVNDGPLLHFLLPVMASERCVVR